MKKKLLILVAASLVLGLSSCQAPNPSSSSEVASNNSVTSNGVVEDAPGFEITTDLTEVKEIHTAQQKAYLSYSGSYETIPSDQYPDGLKHLSDPEPVKLAWKFGPEEGKEVKSYSVTFGQKADLSDGYEFKGTSSKSIDLYNVYLGKNYFKINANYKDGTVESSDIASFTVDSQAPRNLKVDGMTNCRDMGGRTTVNGGIVKQGMIYRTSGTNGWGNGRAVVPDNITDAGKEELLTHLGCKTEINVNSNGSNQVGVKNYVGAYMDYNGGKHHFSRNAESVKKVFATLADEKNYPVFYHCRIGTDRTGLCANLINGLLGVSENEIFQDYLFSNFGNIQEKRFLGSQAGEDNILNYINEIRAMPGENFQQKTYNTLLAIGVPKAQLDKVIDILTDGTKPAGNDNGQLVGMGADLVPANTSKKTSTTNAHPAIYYTLSTTSHTVSYTFTTTEAYTGTIVAYLGNSNSSTTKLSDKLTLKLDGQDVSVSTKTYKDAGFGTCGGGFGGGRTCYYFNILGETSITAGEHTLTLGLKASDTINVGALSIFKK